VALAPEGTRTVSPRLAPFKKGAFHLAIQAGVPMVPIVIRNAGDVAPKGDFVFRPATVDVEILPPVDTSDWTKDTINDHVLEVRNMFLNALGQPEVEKSTVAKPVKKKPKKKAAAKADARKKPAAKAKPKTKAKPKAKAKAKPKTATKPKTKPRSTRARTGSE
jgi:putative phosphoserine phosphatase/1-acylglycerol-3-phosphate O-acyltransferase